MNNVASGELDLNLCKICPGNTLQVLSKLLQCFVKVWEMKYFKIAKIWPVNFKGSLSKRYIFLHFRPTSTILVSKSELLHSVIKIK